MDTELGTKAGYPKYNARVAVPDNTNWSATSDGVVLATGLDFSGGSLYVTIDGQTYISTYKSRGNGGGATSYWPVTKGQVVKITWDANYFQHQVYFCPWR